MTENPARLRLIWDFFGPDAERTALHHRVHVETFAQRERVSGATSGADAGNDGHWMAWLVVDASEVDRVRRALRPQRGLEA
jgi:hypothetical protein